MVELASLDHATRSELSPAILEPSDGRTIGTAELITMMGRHIGRPARLLPVPLPLLRALGAMTGRSALIAGAIDPLAVAPVSEIEALTGWKPVERMPESLSFLRDS
jgi:UDP-glucose 4-epimerase